MVFVDRQNAFHDGSCICFFENVYDATEHYHVQPHCLRKSQLSGVFVIHKPTKDQWKLVLDVANVAVNPVTTKLDRR